MLKIGILGAARIAPEAIIEPSDRRDDTTILAVASRSGNASAYAAQHGIERAYDSYEELLADADVDVIYNALAGDAHAPMSIAALQAGKHVLCEKPSALNAGQAREMVAAAEAAGKRLIEAFHYRHHPGFLHVLGLVQSGKLGRLRSIDVVFHGPIKFSERELRYKWEMGGGGFMDLGSYTIHWCRSLSGEEPEVLEASTERTATDVDRAIKASMRFPSGASASVDVDMDETGKLEWHLTATGENGSVRLVNPCKLHTGHSIEERIAGEPYRVHTVAGGTTYDFQLAALVDAIENGAPIPTEGEDIVANMAAIDAIYAAAGYPPR